MPYRGGGRKILNVGCGTGDASAWLNEHGYAVVSTDISPEMVRLTSARLPQAQNLVLGATELDQLHDVSFDGVIAIHLIQHLNKPLLETFLRQVHDLLANEGKFLLVFTNTCYEKSGYQPEGSKDGVFTVWHKYNLEEIVPLLNKARLKPVQFWTQKSLANACGIARPFAFLCQKA